MKRLLVSHGFTVVEMLLVGGIIGLLSIVVLIGQTQFNRTILLANTVSDIGLSLHNAQLFGVGSRSYGTASNVGYGLDFSTTNLSSYVFFADTDPSPGGAGACHPLPVQGATAPHAVPGDCFFKSPPENVVQTYTLNNGMTISKFCAIAQSPYATYCNTGSPTVTVGHLSVVFARPNTLATFAAGAVGAGVTYHNVSTNPFTEACITVASREGQQRILRISRFGHITTVVPPATCP